MKVEREWSHDWETETLGHAIAETLNADEDFAEITGCEIDVECEQADLDDIVLRIEAVDTDGARRTFSLRLVEHV